MLKVLKTIFLFTLTIIFSFSVGFETLISPIVLCVNLSVQHLTSEEVYHYINNFHMNDHVNSNIKRLQPLYTPYIQFPKLPVASNFPPSQMKLIFLYSWKKLPEGRRKLKLTQLLEQVYLSISVFTVKEEMWNNMVFLVYNRGHIVLGLDPTLPFAYLQSRDKRHIGFRTVQFSSVAQSGFRTSLKVIM